METTWRRAAKDTEEFRKNSPRWFWSVDVAGSAALAGLTTTFTKNTVPNLPVGVLTFFAFVFGMVLIYGIIYLWNLFCAPYRQRNEARQELKQINTELTSYTGRENYQRSNPDQFMSARLDALIVGEVNTWVSADVVIASKLSYSINIKRVHAMLGFLYEDGQHTYDMETHTGQVCSDISGADGDRDITIRVHVDNKELCESLRKSVCCDCSYGWAHVEGKIYITTSDSMELLLELNEKAVLVNRTPLN
jgi:hypothetical protein